MRTARSVQAPVLAAALLLTGCSSGSNPPAAPSNSPSATSSSASTSTPSGTPSSSPPAVRTHLTFIVQGCEGCVLVLWNGRVRTATRILTQTSVAAGRADADVATPDTVGLAVQVNHPRNYGAGNSVPVMVVNYGTPGVAVSPPAAVAATAAHYCWAGTTRPDAVIAMRTTLSAQLPPPYGRILAVWADPSLPSWSGEKEKQPFHGALGIQDSPWCTD